MSAYPEHDKLLANKEAKDTLSELWDWMQSEGIMLCKYGRMEERRVFCPGCMTHEGVALVIGASGLDVAALTARQRQVLAQGKRAFPTGGEFLAYRNKLPTCPTCNGDRKIWETYTIEGELEPLRMTPEDFIGKFLGVDPRKLSEEKDAMLAEIRAIAPPRAEEVAA